MANGTRMYKKSTNYFKFQIIILSFRIRGSISCLFLDACIFEVKFLLASIKPLSLVVTCWCYIKRLFVNVSETYFI